MRVVCDYRDERSTSRRLLRRLNQLWGWRFVPGVPVNQVVGREQGGSTPIGSMNKRFLIIDGNSLLFRAYHALPSLNSSSGQPTGALLGFTEMLLNLLDRERPAAAAIVFDAPGPTFRHERYESYKATRPPTPEDLKLQAALAHDLSRALGLRLIQVAGVEADDVIATLARRGRDQGYEVLMVSGDRDLLQVVGPGVSLLATVRGFTDTRLYDADQVREEFGVVPKQLAELKGLAGDSSDNLPGARGVGPKTAQRLLQEYGSVASIYEHLDEIRPPRVAEALRAGKDDVEMSTALARLKDDVPLDISPKDCVWQGIDTNELRRLLVELEFNKLLPRLRDAEETQEVICDVAESSEDLRLLLEKATGVLAVVVAEVQGQVAGVALACPDRALYVPLSSTPEQTYLFGEGGSTELQAALARALADPQVRKLGVDLKSAMSALQAAGMTLAGLDFDVALAAYLVAPQRGQQPLDALVARYLGTQLPPAEVADPKAAAEPLGRHALCLWDLRESLEREMCKVGVDWLFRKVEMPLIGVLRDMERAGIKVDEARLRELSDELAVLISELARRIYELAGHEFNIDSPKQLGVVLFDELKLPRRRRTKSGYATSADVLEQLAEQHEIARLVLEYREYAKLRSTYAEGLMRLVDAEGRVHTTFEQTITSTGRLSSRNPNLQNIPVRTEWGRKIRACFVPPADGWVLLSADYSQIELRILAHLSQDPQLVEAFLQGDDIHAHTASLIFDVPEEEVDSEKRRVAKTVNFALLYGQGPAALAQQIGVSRQQAEQFIAEYFRRLPKVREYLESTIQQARENLYVETIFGRRRPLPEIASEDSRIRSYAERAATNAPIQGSAADIIKIAMLRLVERRAEESLRARLLLQVHDELVLEAPAEEVATLAPAIREVMSSAAELSVPLTVDVKVGPNWRDMEAL